MLISSKACLPPLMLAVSLLAFPALGQDVVVVPQSQPDNGSDKPNNLRVILESDDPPVQPGPVNRSDIAKIQNKPPVLDITGQSKPDDKKMPSISCDFKKLAEGKQGDEVPCKIENIEKGSP